MGTKMAVDLAKIFMAKVETEILNQSVLRPLFWKPFLDDIFSLWTINREEIKRFIEQANTHHPTINFTAEVSKSNLNYISQYQRL